MNYIFPVIILTFLLGCSYSEEERNFSDNTKIHKRDSIHLAEPKHNAVESVDSITGNHRFKECYANGKLKHEWEEIQMNGGIAVLAEQFYDTTGILILKKEYDYSDGTTYDETHIVLKSIEYYPTGLVKSRTSEEYFMMGERCPCGIWEYFDVAGRLTKKEQKGSCEHLKIDCL